MVTVFDALRGVDIWSVLLKLLLAVFFGGLIGLERGRKRRGAGFRTYMLVCLGATLTMLLGQYEAYMLETIWCEGVSLGGIKTDVSRFGAQVINGIGFLGAGTVIVTGHQQVKGLTTAAGLWACACMGIAIGAGFYECVGIAFLLVFLSMRFLPWMDTIIMSYGRNINLYVEFDDLDNVGEIVVQIKENGAHIFEVEIQHGRAERNQRPSAVLTLRTNECHTRGNLIAAIWELDCVHVIEEI